MTAYIPIADSEIDPESPGTTTLFTKLRDNPISQGEGDSTAPVFAGLSGASLVLLDQQSLSGASQTVFTTGLTSTYDNYIIYISNILNSSDAVGFRMQVSTDSGSTYKSGASDYKNASRCDHSAAAIVSVNGNLSYLDMNGGQGVSNSSTIGGLSGYILFSAPDDSALYFKSSWDFRGYASNGEFAHWYGGGMYQAVTAIDALRIYFSAGTFSGDMALYGVKKV